MSDVFAGLLESFTTLCTCVHTSNTFIWPSSLSGLRVRGSAPLGDKLGITDITNAFLGCIRFGFLQRCVHARVSDTFVWALGLFGSPMHSRSGVTDDFAGLLELPTSPWTCMQILSMLEQPSSPSTLSVHYLVLLVGKYGGSGSSVCVLMMFCM